MSTLAEIEAAAETLPEQEREQLFLFLAARLRAANPAELPPPREFGRERLEEWIRDDEEGMRRFREGQEGGALCDAAALEGAQLLDEMETAVGAC